MRQTTAPVGKTLVGQLRARLDERSISETVKKAWLYWARCFLMFCDRRRLDRLDVGDIEAFLDHLDRQRQATPAARRQALQAVQCLLTDVLDLPIEGLDELARRERQRAMPVILSPGEVQNLLSFLTGADWLLASLAYGSGLRLLECLRLRVRDIDSDRIIVRDGNARFARETVLPDRVREPLRVHLEELKLHHIRQLADGSGGVELPRGAAIPQSYRRGWSWQFIFPGTRLVEGPDPESPRLRTHLSEPEARQIIAAAARQAGIERSLSRNTLRNSFAVHLIQCGVATCDVERLLGVESGAIEASEPAEMAEPSGSRSPLQGLSPVDTLSAH